MRLWKLTDDGLTSFEKDTVPHWMLNVDDVPEDRLVQMKQERPDLTLAPYEVPLDNGRKTFVFAKAPPGEGIYRRIQQYERENPGAV